MSHPPLITFITSDLDEIEQAANMKSHDEATETAALPLKSMLPSPKSPTNEMKHSSSASGQLPSQSTAATQNESMSTPPQSQTLEYEDLVTQMKKIMLKLQNECNPKHRAQTITTRN